MSTSVVGQVGKMNKHLAKRSTACPRVVLAHSNLRLCCILTSSLEKEGIEVVCVRDGHSLLEWLADLMVGELGKPPDLIIADVNLHGRKGVDLLYGFRHSCLSTPFVLIAPNPSKKLVYQAEKMGNAVVFAEPFSVDVFRSTVSLLMYLWNNSLRGRSYYS